MWKLWVVMERFGVEYSRDKEQKEAIFIEFEVLRFKGGDNRHRFPLKQAGRLPRLLSLATLLLNSATTGESKNCPFPVPLIRIREWNATGIGKYDGGLKGFMSRIIADHDWLRALRMVSYGFLLYGPGSYAWYKRLDQCLPQQTPQNLMLKVLLNQIVLGPCVIAVVFAWKNLWLGKLSELPNKYQKDALPKLFYGFRFWIPVSVLNFWYICLVCLSPLLLEQLQC
ncbi:Mpv17/PMP22 [Corchorus olitorius]|uniref:Mpv17/PMP22 n=1 Tax=Corchorus olitorius TaxID=93759 RepID=A0A1R3GN46_9ROSI|nr:Mpv17/PMP22 [Corchorus olitorius]